MARRRNSVDDVTFGRAWLRCCHCFRLRSMVVRASRTTGFRQRLGEQRVSRGTQPVYEHLAGRGQRAGAGQLAERDVDLLARLGELAHRQVTERRPRSERPPGVGDAKERVHALQQTAKRAWVGAPGGPQLRVLKLVHQGHRDRCGEPAKCSGLGSWRPIGIPMRRAAFLRVSFALAALGVLLAVLGTAIVASRASTERAQLDRSLSTAAGEKAALIDTELQRVPAPALVTSPTAHVPVVAATVPVAVDGRVRAYVELELATAALDRVLEADRDPRLGLQVVTGTGTAVAGAGPQFTTPAGRLTSGLSGTDRWRYAVRPVPQATDWYVVAAGRPQSALGLAVQPAQATILALALLAFAVAMVGFRRARTAAAQELAAEQQARAEAEQRSRVDGLTGLRS